MITFWTWTDHLGFAIATVANSIWLWRLHRKVNGANGEPR